MTALYEEHDALIVAAAMGILGRIATAASDASMGPSDVEAPGFARVAEATDAAHRAVFHALTVARVWAEDVHAAGVLVRHIGREPERVEAPA